MAEPPDTSQAQPAVDAQFERVVSRRELPGVTDGRGGHPHHRHPEGRALSEVGERAVQHSERREPSAGAQLDTTNRLS